MPPADRRVVSRKELPTFKKLTDDDAVIGVNMVVFGQPGVGKTTFALEAQKSPYGAETVLIDTDKGRESVLDVDASFVVPQSWNELRGYLDAAMEAGPESPYKTWVFDSLSSIYDELLVPHVVGDETKKPNWDHYHEMQRLMIKLVRDAKSLCEHGVNSIFIGHVIEEATDDTVFVRLGLPQKLRNKILLAVNHVGYLEREVNAKKGVDVRRLHLSPPNARVEGPKFRQTKSTDSPVPLVIENPYLPNIFEIIRKGN